MDIPNFCDWLKLLSHPFQRHRNLPPQVFSQIARSPLPRTPISDVFALEFRSRDELNGGEETHESYLISQYMAGSQSAIGAIKSRAEKEYDLHLLPWTSIAARLDSEDDAVSFQLGLLLTVFRDSAFWSSY